MSIMHFMSILVALETSSLMANSSVLGAVFLLVRAFEDNIWWPSLWKYTAEIACMFLEGIVLASVTIMRVEKEEEALRQRQSRDSR